MTTVDTASRPGVDVPVTIIRPTPGWRTFDLPELWRYRELLFFLTWRDIKVRYKQTVLGASWAILQPFVTMVVMTVFLGRLTDLATTVERLFNAPYAVFNLAGLLPWVFFSQAMAQSGQSLIGSQNLISKIYFPRVMVPMAAVGGGLVDFAISFVILAGVMLYYGVALSWNILLLPIFVFATVLATAGIGMTLAALAVAYRDFRYVIPFIVQTFIFVSPVTFPVQMFVDKHPEFRLAFGLNPMAGIISGFRSSVLGAPFLWDVIAVSFAVTVVIFLAGAMYFRRVERRFADII